MNKKEPRQVSTYCTWRGYLEQSQHIGMVRWMALYYPGLITLSSIFLKHRGKCLMMSLTL